MSAIEIIAALFGFLCVYFYIVRNPWSWPTGLVQVVLLIAVFYQAKLYADTALHLVYAVLQLYGWWTWSRAASASQRSSGANDSVVVPVRRLAPMGHAAAIIAACVMTVVFAGLLILLTDATAPLVDSFIAAVSLVAQCLLAWRYLENWCYWIVVDVVGIGLFAYKELYPTTVLYGLFLVMAVLGFLSWRQAIAVQSDKELALR